MKTTLFRRLCLGLLLARCLSPLAIHAQPSNPGGGGFNGQYNTYTFDNTNWLSSRAQSPVGFTNLLNVTGGDGKALRVDPSPGTNAYLCYHVVETNGATNIQLNLGSVAFWYRPHNWTSTNLGGAGPGEWSRFLEVGRDTNSSSWWSVFTDPGGGNIYFAAQTNTGTATYFLSAPIAFASNSWHYIALTYASNHSGLFVDGAFLTNGSGVTIWPGPEATTNGFFVGSASDGTATMHGDMDDLATYAYQLSTNFVVGTYGALGLPLFGINLTNFVHTAPSTPTFGTNIYGFLSNAFGSSIISGPGYLTNLGASSTCSTNGRPYFTNFTVLPQANGSNTVSFTIQGGTNGAPYDLFYTVALLGGAPTNSPWAWMGQCYSCQRYALTNQPVWDGFFILGTPQDTDGDGLTDAYELLVSQTDPHNPDTNGDGILDGWAVSLGLNPLINYVGDYTQRLNYGFNLVSWLNNLTGIRTETIALDFEGNVTTDQP